jgi:hypothetical protein
MTHHATEVADRWRKIEARHAEVEAMGCYRNAITRANRAEVYISARAECGRYVEIALTGEIPICGETCMCPPTEKTMMRRLREMLAEKETAK